MADLGTDIASTDDLTRTFDLVSGGRCVAEAIFRRWTTPRGGLFYAPAYGEDLGSRLSEGMTPAGRTRLENALTVEALRDERVQACAVTLEFAERAGVATVSAVGTTAEGPFRLVVAVGPELKAQLLIAE